MNETTMEKPRKSSSNGARQVTNGEDPEMDPVAKLFNDQVIQNPVVTDCLLNFLPLRNILTCSLVSKTWNSVTRDFLRRRRQCLMKCTFYDPQGLADRLTILQEDEISNFTNHPFTGLYFVINEKMGTTVSDSEIETSLSNIITEMSKIKRVVLELQEGTITTKLLRAFHLLFKLLPVNEIESLRFFGQFHPEWVGILESVPDKGFSKLKQFESQCNWLVRICTPMHAAILRRCPALSELDMSEEIGRGRLYSEYNKLSIIKKLRIPPFTPLERMKNFEKANIPLEIIQMDSFGEWGEEQFQCLSRILQPCSRSLRKFITWYNKYEEIFKIKIQPMPSVEEVTVYYVKLLPPNDDDNMRNHPHLRKLFPNAVIIPVKVRPKIMIIHHTERGGLRTWFDEDVIKWLK